MYLMLWEYMNLDLKLTQLQTEVQIIVPIISNSSTENSIVMITTTNGNIFRVTGPLCGEFTGHRVIPHTKASDAELWCFL